MSEVPEGSTAPRLLVGRLLAEFLVIVIGVLVALAVDEWRADRNDRGRALQYAARLEANLRADTADLSRYRSRLEEKRRVLRELGGEGRLVPGSDPGAVLDRLSLTLEVGVVPPHAETFREMESSGALSLIENTELRDGLSAYYAFYELASEILMRETFEYGDYRAIVAGAFPATAWEAMDEDRGSELDPAEEVRRGLDALARHPGLAAAANAEWTHSLRVSRVIDRLLDEATGLLSRFEAEHPRS